MSDYDVFSAMQAGAEPLARYRKTIVGKVHVVALNPFSEQPEGVLLEGDGINSYIELWDAKSLVFFERMNKSHLDAGRIVKMEKAPQPTPPSPNLLTDDEIDKLLEGRFPTLKTKTDKFTETAPVLRIINRARELDKSEKIIKYLEEKIVQLELEKYEQ